MTKKNNAQNHYYRFWQNSKVLLPMRDKKYWKMARMDGIIKETLWNTACSSKVPSEVMQEAEEEEISDDEKSDEGNCFDMFEYE